MAQLNTQILLRSETSENWNQEILIDDLSENGESMYHPVGAHAVLGKGEIGVEFTPDEKRKIKIGDGVTEWCDLSYFGDTQANNFYIDSDVLDTYINYVEDTEQKTRTLSEAIKEYIKEELNYREAFNSGDTAIVKKFICSDVNTSKSKYSYTAYVYNAPNWMAMDGNYSAENVYFDDDITFTANIGAVTLESGKNSGTFNAKGKSLEQVLKSLMANVKDPEVKTPTFTLSAGRTTDTGNLELGSKITAVTWAGTYTDGQYQFGWDDNGTPNTTLSTADKNAGYVYPRAMCSPTYSVSCDKAGTKSGDTEDGTFTLTTPITIDSESSKTYSTISNTCTYTDAARTPVNNIGDKCESLKIGTSSIAKSASLSLTGYREGYFCGNLTTAKTEFTSADIRGLTKSGAKFAAGNKTFTVKAGTATIVFAVPSNKSITNILNTTVNANMNEAFGLSTPKKVNVNGANGYAAIEYNVYSFTPPNAYTSDASLTVTLK